MASEGDAISRPQGPTSPVRQDDLQSTVPIAQYIPTNLAHPYPDFNGSPSQGKRQYGSNHDIVGLPSPPVPSPPPDSLHASSLAATIQTAPPFAAPLEIDHDTGYSQLTFGNEAWISPLDVTGAWQLGAPVAEQATAPVFGQFLPGYELPAGYVEMAALQDNSIMVPESANGEGTPRPLMGEAGTPSRTSNPNERTSHRPVLATSTADPSSAPSQSVFDLGPIGLTSDYYQNGTTSSTDALHASGTLESIPHRDVRVDDRQSANLSPTEPPSTSAVALSTSSDSSLVPASPFSSTMTLLTLAQLDLYNARARNRAAATRCRIKQKASIAKLKEAERILMDERDHLLGIKKLLTDQVCGLKELLLMHAKCREDRLIGEYLELTAMQIVETAREAVERRGSDDHIGHSSAQSPKALESLEDESCVE